MSDEQQPRAEWIFPEEKKSNRGGIWLIVGLSVLALAIIGTLLFFILPRGGEPAPTVSPTATETPTPTPTSTPPATPTLVPTADPAPIQPPVPDPDITTFAGQVQPWLDDASTGLSFLADAGPQEATQIVDTLQQDAGRLSDAAAPSAIASLWHPAVGEYAARLGDLRSAIESGAATTDAVNNASAALQELRALVGV